MYATIQDFKGISGGESGALVALGAEYKTQILHLDHEGTIDREAELDRSGGFRLASSSSGWIGVFDAIDQSGYRTAALTPRQ